MDIRHTITEKGKVLNYRFPTNIKPFIQYKIKFYLMS